MRKFWAGTLIVGAGIVMQSSAFAADIAPPPVYDWTGFYIGVNAGAAFGNSDVDNQLGGDFLTDINASDYQNQYTGSLDSDDTSFTGGIGMGYNWQAGVFVFGAEADINYLGQDASSRDQYELVSPFSGDADQRFDSNNDWFGTARLRAGLAADNVLFYLTGGLAYGEVDASARHIENDGSSYDWSGSTSGTEIGWTVGGGAEYAFDTNWIVGAEYLYVDLGSESFDMPNLGSAGDDFSMRGNVDTKFSVLRASVKYKF